MKIDFENLDWDEATVLDGRYIYYLALMLDERASAMGLNPSRGYQNNFNKFNINEFTPTGFFRFQELYDIYTVTLNLAQSTFINEDRLNADLFVNHKLRKYIFFTMKDLCEITDFDFYSNPLIPNQRLNYYDKFLKPLYLIIKKFKKYYFNKFFELPTSTYMGEDLTFPHATDLSGNTLEHIVNNLQQDLAGSDLLDFYSFQNLKDREVINPQYHAHINGGVGGVVVRKMAKRLLVWVL